jgi:hypothetical protein
MFFTSVVISLLIWALGATITIILSILSLKPTTMFWRGMIGLSAWIFGIFPAIIGAAWFLAQLLKWCVYGHI